MHEVEVLQVATSHRLPYVKSAKVSEDREADLGG